MYRKLTSWLIFHIAFLQLLTAQTKVGYNMPQTAVQPGAWLELTNNMSAAASSWEGLQLPKVNFSSLLEFPANTSWGISGLPVTGMIVYNTGARTSNGFSGPGIYLWNGGQWGILKSQPVSADWSLTGNAGTNPSTDFAGTRDAVPFSFRANNLLWGTVAASVADLGLGGLTQPLARLHLLGNGMSGFSPATGTGGAELAFSKGGFGNPGASVQMIDYGNYSAGICFNVRRGTSNSAGGLFSDSWPADVVQAVTITNTGKTGIGSTSPVTSVQVGGAVGIMSATVAITADNQLVNPGNFSYLSLQSNNATATNRTITIGDGLVTGQVLYIECSAGALEVQDNDVVSNANLGLNRSLGINDVLQLLWNGISWIEIRYSNN